MTAATLPTDVDAAFVPAAGLRDPDLQTLWSACVKRAPRLPLRRERFELADGDHLTLAWGRGCGGPLVVVLHGLTGSADSPYVRRLLQHLGSRGFTGVVLEGRGCDGSNRTLRFQHAGETGDLDRVIAALHERYPDRPIGAVGYSLGGNILLNWLAQQGVGAGIAAACAVSVPFDLGLCAAALETGFSRVYQLNLLQGLKRSMRLKLKHPDAPVSLQDLRRIRTLRAFDDRITAPIHGFTGADDYYRRSSCRQNLPGISHPTLIVHAFDDPFVPARCVPKPDALPDNVELALSAHGGHVGFVAQHQPRWLESRLVGFLAPHFAASVPAEL